MKVQSSFADKLFEIPKDAFGGSLLKGHPKRARPLSSEFPVHMVVKATTSVFRSPKNFNLVDGLVRAICKKHGVTLYEFANVFNHLHLLIKIPGRRRWDAFIRDLTGQIAQKLGIKWVSRPFTRIVRGWRKAFRIARQYVQLNQLEGDGLINRRETKTLKDLRAHCADG